MEKQYTYCGLTCKLILQGTVYYYQAPSALNFLGLHHRMDRMEINTVQKQTTKENVQTEHK